VHEHRYNARKLAAGIAQPLFIMRINVIYSSVSMPSIYSFNFAQSYGVKGVGGGQDCPEGL